MTGREYMERVRAGKCVICLHKFGHGVFGCEAHHIGTGNDHLDFAVAALCVEHHRGPTGVHGMHRRSFYTFWKTSEIQLLAWTTEEVMR